MKKIIALAIAAIMSLGASAQLITSNTVTHHKKSNNYNRLTVSYNSLSTGDMDVSMSGLSFAWTKGYSVSKDMPLFIETGIGMTYGWNSEDMDIERATVEMNSKFLSLQIPVNLTYKFNISEGLRVAPFAGVYFRGNIVGETNAEYRGEELASIDWYDDYDATRFNVGWQIGAGLEYKKLYLGLSYGSDFNKFVGEGDASSSMGNFAVSLGLVF